MLDDGTELLPATLVTDSDATLVLPQAKSENLGQTLDIRQAPTHAGRALSTEAFSAPEFRPAEPSRKSALPWILGIVVVLGASAIIIALILVRALLPTQSQRSEPVALATPSPAPVESLSQASPPATPPNSANSDKPVASSSPVRSPASGTEAQPTPGKVAIIAPRPIASPGEPQPTPPRPPTSGGVMNGKAVYLVQPSYPPIARQAHASGLVVVQVLIDENGHVIAAHATSGHPLLQSAAVAAARASKFSPTKLSGQPVKVTGTVQYNFVAQ